ncbi:MAG TPA: TlpA disulfide reductase family protein [Nitrolancea sp.]|nr:TlpA disulfide reductase family protein [Nitrolancea sp.]
MTYRNGMGDPRRTRRQVVLAGASMAGAVLLAACSTSGETAAGNTTDFKLVGYESSNVIFPSGTTNLAKIRPVDKPLILNFWAGDCPACQSEMPAFQRVADQYGDRIMILGVDLGVFTGLGSHESAKRLFNELSIHYPTAYAVDDQPVHLFRIQAMPTTVFFTRTSRILTTSVGMLSESQLRGNVERLLAA